MRIPLLAAALAAVVLTATPGHAAPFRYTDRAGDHLVPHAGLDIVSVTYAARGRRPAEVVVSLELAAEPLRIAGVGYRVEADIAGCGYFRLAWTPGTVYATTVSEGWLFAECGDPAPTVAGALIYVFPIKPAVSGRTVTWTVPARLLPGHLVRGARVRNFLARTEFNESVHGYAGTGTAEPHLSGAVDVAESAATWRLG